MSLRQKKLSGVLAWMALTVVVSTAYSQGRGETFTASAAVKTAGKASASAPVTITIDRMMSQSEADTLVAALTKGGASGLRKALVGVPPTGSVRLGAGPSTPTRVTIERPTETGRLLTIVTDQPILFLGAGAPSAKPKAGYDFAILHIEVDAKGSGSGTFAPAATLTVKQGALVVDDYASELVRLTGVSKVK
jgi:hypothetical protein